MPRPYSGKQWHDREAYVTIYVTLATRDAIRTGARERGTDMATEVERLVFLDQLASAIAPNAPEQQKEGGA